MKEKGNLHSNTGKYTLIQTFRFRHVGAKQFSGQEVDHATVICIATQSINPHQQQQENDQHYGHNTTFTQAVLGCKQVRKNTRGSVYRHHHLMNQMAYERREIEDCSLPCGMKKWILAGLEKPLTFTATISA